MNPRPQQAASERHHGAGVDTATATAIAEHRASEGSTKAQYGDAHERVSRRARSSSSAHQHQHRRSLTAAALEAHSSGEKGGSHRREPRDDTLAQVGTRDRVRPQRRRRRSTGGTAPLPLSLRVCDTGDEAVVQAPEQALRGDGVTALESKLKSVHFNPQTTEFGDAAGPTYGTILPAAAAKALGPRVFVERMLDEYGDLRTWYR